MKIVLIISLLLCMQLSFAQTNVFTSSQIDSIVKIIDSTCVRAGISDGVIKNPETTETIGGFSYWYFTDSTKNHLVRVVDEQSAYSYDFTYYYFFEDKLINLFFKRGEETADKIKTTSIGKYYFQNDKLIYKDDEIDFSFDKSFYLKMAKGFLKDSMIWKTLAKPRLEILN
ncbi:MAG: hypothetical protein ABI402_00155 [Ferruginibacter sp.]